MNSSSSSSSSFELHLNDPAMGCLSGILRRLLCQNARTHAAPQPEEAGCVAHCAKSEQKKSPPSPGLVARLMGLDSMPVFPYTPKSSMGRSRSTSSLESWPLFLPAERSRGSPQIQTSVSFREVPTFLKQENEDFLLLTFVSEDVKGGVFQRNEAKPKKATKNVSRNEADGQKEERKSRSRNEQQNSSPENAPVKKHHNTRNSGGRAEAECRNRRRPRKRVEDSVEPVKQKIKRKTSKVANKRGVESQRRMELECSSQNSSPDSVLDNPFDIDCKSFVLKGSPVSEEKKLRRRSRRKISSDLEDHKCQSPVIEFIADDGGLRLQNQERKSSHSCNNDSSPDLWEKICRLADEEVRKWSWHSREALKSEESEEVAAITGLEILDFLLHELVNELRHI